MSFPTRNWWQQTLLTLDQLTVCTRNIVRGPVSRRSWQRELELSHLEPRILFSAAPMDVAAADPADDSAVMVAEADPAESSSSSADGASQNETAQAAVEIVVVDSRVQDLEQLLEDLGRSERNFEVVVLDSQRDGVDQISEILAGRSNVSSLHIVSHAEDFAVRLGNVWLSSENLDGYAGQIAGWNSSLNAGADILFYGCDLASGESGRTLIDSVSTLTGADVAASDDDTGYANFGADWDLEYHTGEVESQVAFSAGLQQNWSGKLATVTVDTLIDEELPNGLTSLREAITQATAGDTIVLGAGTYNLTIDTLEINKNLTITGVDARTTIIDGSVLGKRVFELQGSSIVTMSSITIQGGDENNGGGILVNDSAVLNLSDAHLRNNSSNNGGAIHVDGTAHLQRVLLFNNNASGKGGAIYFDGGSAGSFTNVTTSGNTADDDGGGLYTESDITITNSTITLNQGDNGGGIVNDGAVVTISNTIVAGNTATTSDPDVMGAFSSDGANLIQSLGSATGFDSDITGVNPNLAALTNNGGSTDTHAIGTSSAAYHAGTATTAASVDQRGVARSGSVDIGAYEHFVASSILLSTDETVSGSGAPGLSGWDAGEVIDFGSINSLDPVASVTDGSFSSFFNLSSFVTGGADIEAIHFVTDDITVGNISTIALQAGDILFATRDTENLVSTNSLTVTRNDLVIFRPDSVGDYSSGTFTILLENPTGYGFHAVSMITKNTLVGDVLLAKGSFLIAHTNSSLHHQIQYYTPDNVGAANTSGTLQTLIDESSILSGQIQGLDLIEDSIEVGGHMLNAGEILVSVKDGGNFGSNSASANGNDIFSISITSTDLGSAASNFTATLVMDGSDVGLDTLSEQIFGFSLSVPTAPANAAPVITSNGGGASAAINVSENTVAVTTVTATDADIPAQTLTYSISGGSDAAKFKINSSTGALSFVTPPNFEAANDVGTNNIYDVTVSVTDGTLSDTQTLAVNVTDASETISPTNEFVVNDQIGDQQITSAAGRGSTRAVSMAADGSYVVVWTSLNQDGSGKGVYAQRFSASGSAITTEFLVNETPANDQQWASVSSAFDGTFVVTWTSNQGTAAEDIYYRRFAANGTALTTELIANTSTSGTQKNSIIGMNASTGEFVIAWQGNGTQSGEIDADGIFAQRFDSSGSAVGSEFRVNSSTGGTQYDAAISVNNDGDFVVAWDDTNGVHFQRFDDNANEQGGQVTVSGSSSAGNAAVAMHSDGSFVIVWRQSAGLSLNDVFLQRYSNTGSTLGSTQTVADTSSFNQVDPSIAMDDEGDFIVVWEGYGSRPGNADSSGVFGQKYHANGSQVGNEFRVNESTSGTQSKASLAMLDIDNFVVVWSGEGDQAGQVDDNGVFARQYGTATVNTAPTVTLTNKLASLAENADTSSSIKISDIVISDDGNGTNVLSLEGDDAAMFEIVGGNELHLKAGVTLDFETNPSLDVTVHIDDAQIGVTFEDSDSLTITISDTNDAPTVTLTPVVTTLAENADTSSAIIVATITVNDDALGTETLSLSGADAALFEIVGNDLRLKAGASLDFETNPSLDVTVNVDDATITGSPDDSAAYSVSISDTNDAPTVTLTPVVTTLAENADTSSAITVATITVNDDALGTETLSLSGADAALFEIVGNDLRLKAGASLDFETNPSLDVTVNVDDATITGSPDDSAAYSVSISDTNDAPTVTLTPVVTTLAENADTSSAITVATITVDDDALGTETLSLSGADAALFEIVGNDLRLKAGASLDFESNPSLDVTVNVDDATITGSPDHFANHSVSITNQNDAPTIAGTANKTLNDNSTAAIFSTVTISDIDGDNVSVMVSLSGGDANGSFTTASLIASGFSYDGGGVYSRAASSAALAETAIRQLVFDPTENQAAVGTTTSTTITITVDDSQTTQEKNIVVDATSINDDATGQPVIVGVAAQGQTLTADTSGIADADGLGSFVYQWSRGGGVIAGATSSTYTLTAADAGSAIRVSVSFTDALGSNEGPLVSNATLNVVASNTAPVMTNTQVNTISGQRTEFSADVFQQNTIDVDGDPMTAVLVTPPASGSLTLDPTGQFVYTSEVGFTGTVSFQWKANDGASDSNVATVVINVRPAAIPLPLPPVENTPEPEDNRNDDTSDDNSDSDADNASDNDATNVANIGLTGMQSERNENEGMGIVNNNVVEFLQVNDDENQEITVFSVQTTSQINTESDSGDEGSYRSDTSVTSKLQNADSGFNDSAFQAISVADYALLTSPGQMWDQLDNYQKQLDSQIQGDLIMVGTAGAAASSFTVGIVAWALRSGFLVSGLLAHMPAWRAVDPLLIMQGMGASDDGESLEELMDRRNQEMDE